MKISTHFIAILLAGTFLLGCQSAQKSSSLLVDDEQQFHITTAEFSAVRGASSFSNAQVAELKNKLKDHPEDSQTRLKLLAFTFHNYSKNEGDKQLNHELILWLVQNQPESTMLSLPYVANITSYPDSDIYKQVKQLWTELIQKNPGNQNILDNAIVFFHRQEIGTAENLTQQTLAKNPKSLHWHNKIFQIYRQNAGFCDANNQAVQKAYSEIIFIKKNFAGTNLYEETDIDLARYSYLVGDIEAAQKEATQLLSNAQKINDEMESGNYLFNAHLILGLISLDKKDYTQASKNLLDSASAKSPQLDSFGPNLCLAKRLLEQNKSESVLEYFDRLKPVWAMGGDRISKWKQKIRKGQIPDFGANLNY